MSNTPPLDWEVSSLDQVFSEIKNGCSIDQNTSGDGIPVTRIETISQEKIDYSKIGWVETTDDIDRFKIEKHDILLSHINSLKHIGKTAIKEDDRRLYHGMNLLRLKVCKSKFHPIYIHNLLSWEVVREEMRRKAKQAINQASLNVQDIKSLTYALPPLPEQQKIATILSSVDDVIEKTRAQIDKLKDLKTGMMQELLTKGIGHTEFKDSPVGRIPVEWDVVTLEQICDPNAPITYGVLKPGNYVDGGRPLLQIKDLGEGTILAGGLHLIGDDLDYEYRRSRVQFGDIVISLIGTIGRTAMIPCWLNQSNIHRNLGRIRTRHNQYVFQFLQSESAKLQLGLTSAGSSQSALNLSALRQMSLPLPSPDEAQEITKILSSVDERIKVTTSRLNQLNNVKKALMQDLLTGKVRVNLKI